MLERITGLVIKLDKKLKIMKIRFLIPTLFFSILLFSQNQNKVNVQADIRGHSCSGGFGLCTSNAISEKLNSNITV